MTTATYSAAYLAEAIADEAAIGRLLGWRNLDIPKIPGPNNPIWGIHDEQSIVVYGAKQEHRLPMWRRSWAGAGELIGLCYISMVYSDDACGVASQHGVQHWAKRADHPTRDDAIRAAICKAAIAYLTAERDAKVPA